MSIFPRDNHVGLATGSIPYRDDDTGLDILTRLAARFLDHEPTEIVKIDGGPEDIPFDGQAVTLVMITAGAPLFDHPIERALGVREYMWEHLSPEEYHQPTEAVYFIGPDDARRLGVSN